MDESRSYAGLTDFGRFAREARAEANRVFPGVADSEYRLRYFDELLRRETMRTDRTEWIKITTQATLERNEEHGD